MSAYHSVMRGGRAVWDRDLMPAEQFAARIQKLREAMKSKQVAITLVYGDIVQYGDLCYFSNYYPMTRDALLIIPLEGEPVLFANLGTRDLPFACTLTWVKDVKSFSHLEKELPEILSSALLSKAKIGGCGLVDRSTVPLHQRIMGLCGGSEVCDLQSEVERLRARKSEHEISILKEAATRAESVLSRLDRQCLIHEEEIGGLVEREARKLGAEDVRLFIHAEADGYRKFRPLARRVIPEGDIISLYLALSYQRYWGEAGRTFRQLSGKLLAVMSPVSNIGIWVGEIFHIGRDFRKAVGQLLGSDGIDRTGSEYFEPVHGIGLDLLEKPMAKDVGYLSAANTCLSYRLFLKTGNGFSAFSCGLHVVRDRST